MPSERCSDGISQEKIICPPYIRTPQKHDIQVTDNGNDKRRHQGVSIRRPTLNYRHDRTADNRGTQHTGSRVGEFAQPFGCQRENRREHNRVEKPMASSDHIATSALPLPVAIATASSTTAADALNAK